MKHAMMLVSCIILSVYAAIGWGFSHHGKSAGSIHVNNGNEADFVDMVPISMESAVKAALWSVPGKAFEAELEKADGYLVYRVGILRDDHQIADVKVDAGNSKVLKIDVHRKTAEDQKLKTPK